jgi:DNA modification methylase
VRSEAKRYQKSLVGQKTLKFKRYAKRLTVEVNGKGVMDIDTVKGCSLGMKARPGVGCYGSCYANKLASLYGYDFPVSVSRKIIPEERHLIERKVRSHASNWFRIGTMGDPCHDWNGTVEVCDWLGKIKTPVIITKHWVAATTEQLLRLKAAGAVFNTSLSALDTDEELEHRLLQFYRIGGLGLISIARIVSAKFGETPDGQRMDAIQKRLYALKPQIDNPLRVPKTHPQVASGDIIVEKRKDINASVSMSIYDPKVFTGKCQDCSDQCGVPGGFTKPKEKKENMQTELFKKSHAFEFVTSVIGSGYEDDVAKLAIEDKIAMRAARKNMQIHSAIILKVDGEFAGFFTFQINDEVREFCLLQSVIKPEHYTPELYREMVLAMIDENKAGYPMLITTDPKSKFETPKLFESVGFQTYIKMSNFHYMVKGDIEDVRLKIMCRITMTNVWNSIKGDWLRLKKEWRARIEEAGKRAGVENPSYASREGCWQGSAGFSNVVNTKRKLDETGAIKVSSKAHNGNASVLDPVACEAIAKLFMKKGGKRVYNPFGGGVQFGYIAGACGYEYVASEIRQNQCDANNKICSEFDSVKWIKSDSSTYEPDGKFDLVFTCPPYYRVEKYIDYDGSSPDGEINSLDTYEKFRDTLFAGYKKAIEVLDDNSFFVVMTGDSRDKHGAYYCCESEHEIFFKENGLSVYNKIVYLECEFTRLAQAKKTLHVRKFPKREQKIIVAYKGDMKKIKNFYQPVGRL